MTIEEFIGKAQYDQSGQTIFGLAENDDLQMIAQVRGWGAIQHLFKNVEDAEKFQDELGEWIADAINKKLSQLVKEEGGSGE